MPDFRRWSPAVLGEFAHGGRRHRDLHTALGWISHKVLTEILRRAERDGPIARHVDHNRVETAILYELTDLACSLEETLRALASWAKQHWVHVDTARQSWTSERPMKSEHTPRAPALHLVFPATREEAGTR